MNLGSAIESIRFWSGTVADITNHSANNLFGNKQIVTQLQFALNEYSRTTKAIEDIYSFSLNTGTPFVSAPPLALRGESYRAILFLVGGRFFAGDMQTFSNVYSSYPVSNIQGITTWFMPWGTGENDRLYVFPLNSTTPSNTTLDGALTATTTTITVASTAGFLKYNGKVTIGNEKIHYTSATSTQFLGCKRGMEQSTASAQISGIPVYENNVWLMYSRLHIPLYSYSDIIPRPELELELELPEEHVETILKYATYNLLIKIDVNRANAYKVDWVGFMEKAKQEIRTGRSRIKAGRNIRSPKWNEESVAYWPNLF